MGYLKIELYYTGMHAKERLLKLWFTHTRFCVKIWYERVYNSPKHNSPTFNTHFRQFLKAEIIKMF